MRPRIYADFLNADGDGTSQWLRLICRRTFDDLAKNKLELKEGLGVTFYADDTDDDGNYDELEADGACHFDAKCQYWFGRINWTEISQMDCCSWVPRVRWADIPALGS
jgi:hypothetical protein